jgi:hypothetical protein
LSRASEKEKRKWLVFTSFWFALVSLISVINLKGSVIIFSLALQPPWALASDFSVLWSFYRQQDSLSDQLIARPLPKHRTTQTQNKHIHIPNIHALCGIRTRNPSFRASKDSTCLRPLGYRDQQRKCKALFKL